MNGENSAGHLISLRVGTRICLSVMVNQSLSKILKQHHKRTVTFQEACDYLKR